MDGSPDAPSKVGRQQVFIVYFPISAQSSPRYNNLDSIYSRSIYLSRLMPDPWSKLTSKKVESDKDGYVSGHSQ